jgi:anaerobic dimethyl sulfoxide reductase subunit C (anchor subunit)
MNVQEWALIIFTILAQMSVGSFIVLGIVHFFARRAAGAEEADRLSDRALLAIGPVLVLAMLASLWHLGTPLNAPRAVSNLATSWLSREIFFGVLFAVVGAVFALMQWRKIGSIAARNAVAWIAAVIGIVFVVSMSMVYMLPTQPAWNSIATPVSFLTTTALLGIFATGAAFIANYAYVKRSNPDCADVQCDLLRGVMRWLAVVALVLLGVELVVLPLYLGYLATGNAAAVASAGLLVQDYGLLLGLRIAFVFIGAGILALFIYQNASRAGREQLLGTLAYSAFVLVFVAEVMGRYLFYATHINVGV